jgi:hypothetical protein
MISFKGKRFSIGVEGKRLSVLEEEVIIGG